MFSKTAEVYAGHEEHPSPEARKTERLRDEIQTEIDRLRFNELASVYLRETETQKRTLI